MSEEKSAGEAPQQPQQSFGEAPPAPPVGQQSFGDAPPAQPPAAPPPPPPAAPPPPPPAAPMPPPAAQPPAQPAGEVTLGDAPTQPAGDVTFGEAPPAPPAPPVPPVAEPAKKKGGVLRIIGGVAVALLLLCVVLAFVVFRFVNSNAASDLQVGDCIADVPTVAEGENRAIENVRKVDCTDAAATHKVEGRYEDRTAAEAAEVCAVHPTADYYITTANDSGSRGYVLCLSQST